MQDLYGTYRGLTPTDESAVGLGEITITIDANTITTTVATGLGIEEEAEPLAMFREMTADEISVEFNEGADLTGVHGIISAEAQPGESLEYGRILIMPGGPNDETVVVLRGLFGEEAFGPTYLFTPEQVSKGMFDQAVKAVEEEHGTSGIIPMIENDGVAPAKQTVGTSSE